MARIALLFSGLPRQWSYCVQSHLALFPGHQVDVFFHFWDTIGSQEKQDLLQAYQPRTHAFQAPLDFSPIERQITRLDNINSPSRMFSMYYSWKRVAALFEEFRRSQGVKYDYLVRLRADLLFFEPLSGLLPAISANDLFLSDYNDFNIVNDMFAMGGPDPLLYYHSLYDHLMQYKDEVVFTPEILLMHHLNCNPLRMCIGKTKIVMLVFRPHMVGMPIEECLKEHPGASKWKDQEVVASHRDFHGRRRGAEGILHVEQFKNAQLRELEKAKLTPPKSLEGDSE